MSDGEKIRENEWYEVSIQEKDDRCNACKDHKIIIVHHSSRVYFLHTTIGWVYPDVRLGTYLHCWFEGERPPLCLNSYKLVKKEKV